MYKATIGLEVHLELKTKSKMFTASKNDIKSLPNHNTSFGDLAFPGTLPCLNKMGVELGLKAAILLNTNISKVMRFDRKIYFYPDNSKGYQITQDATPIGRDGYVLLDSGKKIRIHDLHLEEDTSKCLHKNGKTYLDFNRGGASLVEIVTEADVETAEEAVEYLEKLREMMLYAGVSDCKIEEGSMRCDANISVSKTDKLGTRIEIKNIGSIQSVGEAIKVETKRQIEELEKGNKIVESTRRYDEKTKATYFMRNKENKKDYRYYREANIPTLILSDEYINKVKEEMPYSASVLRNLFGDKGIKEININKIINNHDYAELLSLLIKEDIDLVLASNLLLGPISEYLNKHNLKLEDTRLDKERFILILKAINNKELSKEDIKKNTKTYIMNDSFKINKEEAINDKELVIIIDKIIKNNPEEVKELKEGNDRKLKFFMGEIMKETKGKANPHKSMDLIKEAIKKK